MWDRQRRGLTVGLVLLVTFVASEALAVATVMPKVEADLGDLWLYGWVFSGFFLGSLAGIVLAGRASDRVRPVVPFTVGLGLFMTGLVIGGLAHSMAVLVAARLLQGLGAGALPTVAYVAIGREYPPEARPRMFALLSTAWVVPSLLGPGLAAVVGERFGWRWVFLGLAPLVAVCGLAVMRAIAGMPAHTADLPVTGGETDPWPDVSPDGSGDRSPEHSSSVKDALLVTVGAGLTLAGLDQSSWVAAVPLVVLGLLVLVPAFRRLTPPGTLSARPGLPAAVLVRGVLTFAFFQADAYVPLSITTVRGGGTKLAGVVLTSSCLLWTAGSWVQAHRMTRTGPRVLVRSGFLLVGAGIGLLMVTLSPGVPVALGIVAWGVGGLGIGMAYAPLTVTALDRAGAGREGSATSALQLSDVLGTALGTGIGGVVLAAGERQGWPPRPGLLVVFAMALTMAAVGVVLSRRLPATLARPAPPTGGDGADGGHVGIETRPPYAAPNATREQP